MLHSIFGCCYLFVHLHQRHTRRLRHFIQNEHALQMVLARILRYSLFFTVPHNDSYTALRCRIVCASATQTHSNRNTHREREANRRAHTQGDTQSEKHCLRFCVELLDAFPSAECLHAFECVCAVFRYPFALAHSFYNSFAEMHLCAIYIWLQFLHFFVVWSLLALCIHSG